PRQMWRSEPQMPPRVIFTSAASGSISGTAYSRISKSPWCFVMTATRPFMASTPLLDRGLHLEAARGPLLAGQVLPLALDEARLLVGPRREPRDQLGSALVHGVRPFILYILAVWGRFTGRRRRPSPPGTARRRRPSSTWWR